MISVYFVDVDHTSENEHWKDGFTKAKIKDEKWLELGSEEFQLFNESQTIPSLAWMVPVAPTSEQIILITLTHLMSKSSSLDGSGFIIKPIIISFFFVIWK